MFVLQINQEVRSILLSVPLRGLSAISRDCRDPKFELQGNGIFCADAPPKEERGFLILKSSCMTLKMTLSKHTKVGGTIVTCWRTSIDVSSQAQKGFWA